MSDDFNTCTHCGAPVEPVDHGFHRRQCQQCGKANWYVRMDLPTAGLALSLLLLVAVIAVAFGAYLGEALP